MKLNLSGNIEELKNGIDIFSERLEFTCCESGILVNIQHEKGDLRCGYNGKEAYITYDSKIHFFRALGILVENLRENKQFEVCETPQFDSSGVMLDVSRNAVMTVGAIKDYLYYMAVMGLNMMMLYTEDIYEIEGYPYFGHMRGRYSLEELRECDDYAFDFGIEMVPCIQTLGHLDLFLRQRNCRKYADTASVLMMDDEEVLKLIDKMLETMSKAFRSRKIHIGMDETGDLGRGAYLAKHGLQDQTKLFIKHINVVSEMCKKYNYKPMIWSDMLFYLRSETGFWYEPTLPIPDGVIEALPKDLDYVYWDYYNDDQPFYEDFIDKHIEMGIHPMFAGGIWVWTSVQPNYRKTYVTTNSALTACKKKGVKDVFATVWFGSPSPNIFSTLLGAQLYAEHMYHKEVDENEVDKRFEFSTGCKAADFKLLSLFDEVEGVDCDFCEPPNTAYSLLWHDVMYGLYDCAIKGLDLKRHYEKLLAELEKVQAPDKFNKYIFDIAKVHAKLLSIKGDMSLRIKDAYDKGDKEALRNIAKVELPQTIALAEEAHEIFRNQWFAVNKSIGFEGGDNMYSLLVARLKTAKYRLDNYVDGNITKLEEVEQPRLSFFARNPGKYSVRWSRYWEVVSAGIL